MCLIAGIWYTNGRGERRDVALAAADSIAAQAGTPHGVMSVARAPDIAFARLTLPVGIDRERSSAPADVDPSDRLLFAIDARIDNREELFAALGARPDPAMSDQDLIALAYRRWRDGIVDRLLGDYAIAIWDGAVEALTLIRDPTGQRPLHYRMSGDIVAFASMPQGLIDVGPHARVDATRLAGFVADLPLDGSATFFDGIDRVEAAQMVRIDRAGIERRRYWTMPRGELRFGRDRDYVDAFREQLDRAVRVRLRGAGDIVAAHLSAGLDSGAVAATAASLMAPTGRRLLAITSAPRLGFDGPVPPGRIADESIVAATIAARYANIDHLVVRSGAASPLDHLADDSMLFARPIGHPCNNVWWRTSNQAARDRGATVMLTGEMGNLTISAGTLHLLHDMIRSGHVRQWLRTVRALERDGGPRWRGLLAASFAPWVPSRLVGAMSRFSSGGASGATDRLYRGSLPPAAAVTPRRIASDRERRWAVLMTADPGNFRKGALLRWGIDERDPTSDRRLIDFCFSLPAAQLLRAGRTRGLARVALADRLPGAVLDGVRGYQYADWYEALDRDRLAVAARRMRDDGVAAAAIDLEAVDRLIAAWPPGDWGTMRTIGTYRVAVLRALAAGAFALNAQA